jgi:CBS domain-containing protein
MLRVKHLLSVKGSQVLCIDAEDPVLRAIQVMAENHIGALPVVRGSELVGIVSERDYARKIILHGRSSAETAVWEIMTAPVITVTPDATVQDCMQLVTNQRVRHLPVVERGQLVGIVSIGDLVRAVIDEQQETITQLERFIAS